MIKAKDLTEEDKLLLKDHFVPRLNRSLTNKEYERMANSFSGIKILLKARFKRILGLK